MEITEVFNTVHTHGHYYVSKTGQIDGTSLAANVAGPKVIPVQMMGGLIYARFNSR